MPTRVGTVIAGKYRLQNVIGAGSFGEVYKAEHVGLGKIVAVKLLQLRHAQDRQLVRRFQDEARRAAALHHPGIIEVHDVGVTDDGAPYQVMDFLAGISLGEELRLHRQLPIGRAIALAVQVLDALAVAHAAGIIHRDIKPENLFLERDPRGERLKVLDFGIAKVLDTGPRDPHAGFTAAGRPLGTPYYMAPEQALDPSRVDARADVYSVGATLFEMLAGRTVVLPGEVMSVIGHVIAGDIERRPRVHRTEVPVWLDEIVSRALGLHPSERFADAAEMLGVLRAGQREASGAGPAAVPAERGRMRRRSVIPSLTPLVGPQEEATHLEGAAALLEEPTRLEDSTRIEELTQPDQPSSRAMAAGLGTGTEPGTDSPTGPKLLDAEPITDGGDGGSDGGETPTRAARPGGFLQARTAMLAPTVEPPPGRLRPHTGANATVPQLPRKRARTPGGEIALPVPVEPSGRASTPTPAARASTPIPQVLLAPALPVPVPELTPAPSRLPRRRTWIAAAAGAILALAVAVGLWLNARTPLAIERALAPTLASAHLARAQLALDAGDGRRVLEELTLAAPLGASPAGLLLDARARILLGDVDGAAQALELARAEGLPDEDARLARAALALARGDAREAAEQARTLWEAGRDAEAAVLYGSALARLGDRLHARPILQAAAAAPRGRAAFLELARLERAEGRFAEAATAYTHALELDPRRIGIRLEALALAFDTGDARGARVALDGLLVDAPADLTVLAACARVRTSMGDVTRARACLDQAAELPGGADSAVILRERGRLALALGYPAAARAALDAAAHALPDDAETQLLALDAHVADDGGNPTDRATRIEQRFAGKATAELARGRAALARGDAAGAVRAFAFAATTLDTTDEATPRERADAHLWLGRAQLAVRDHRSAEDSFHAAVGLWPPGGEAHFQLGRLLLEHGRLPAARDQLLAATAADANHAEAYFWLGETYVKLGQRERAAAAYDRSVAIAPAGPLAAQARVKRRAAVEPVATGK